MKIGVTINVGNSSIWSNGVNQNGIYLGMLLKEGGHDSNIIYSQSTADNNTKKFLDEIPTGVNSIELQESFKTKFDVVIQLGLTIEKSFTKHWKEQNPNVKIVAYECGNHFIIDSEKILFNAHSGNVKSNRVLEAPEFDQIWSIPQMENSCLSYYKFKRQCKNATVVPFIWDPIAIESNAKKKNYQLYSPRDIKKIAVMEPNISVMKNCIIPIVTLDNFVREYENKLEKIFLVGGQKIKDNETFKSLITGTELLKRKLLTAEHRVQTHRMLNNYVDLVLSWQWENNLNYLYFDICWLGWPLIHNANLCKDVGYYYNEFNADEGAAVLNKVIKNHNLDKKYIENQRNIISRFTNKNKKMILQYNELLEDLVNDKFRKRSYDWKTNTIK